MTASTSTSASSADAPLPFVGRAYRCACGQPLFFRNGQCVVCERLVGYDPASGEMRTLEAAGGRLWHAVPPDGATSDNGDAPPLVERCANLDAAAACNWLVAVDAARHDETQPAPLCIACRLNRTVPDPSVPRNAENWRRTEVAKRRLVSSLVAFGLPVASLGEDPEQGLAFDLLAATPDQPTITTGHADGIITVDVGEADDLRREAIRRQMHEPYRTMLGHLRHEVGHYYWQRLVQGSRWHEGFRELFGDETADYAAALQRHYDEGPPDDWQERHVSAYASAHPWEDWAETWAHLLHMMDSIGTARSFGLRVDAGSIAPTPMPATNAFDALFDDWLRLSGALNEMSYSMGLADFYPFVLSPKARRKLAFVHRVIRG